ncbi:DNA repair ATPase [Hahella sp. CCB-MM4]|uniref:DNA repair ATPase n=1 Tax=Hahella sp. (strain CCB-MM4) TaxID=1926491 RepID=UPI000B9BCE07|nr:DNA repair ATPase [Hahella sp. CCB-MM4]OZG74014.1 DNA repair ATPase [Hahella sp. CCB-MM4]
MARPSKDDYEAVLFLEDQYVSRQMRYSEFEAILDNVVPLSDLADTEISAVYVQMNQQLAPRALVFFKLYFDEEGLADPEWNVPLKRLASISGSGPDLGGGPIRLACRSQCAISWHQRDLWDPDMRPGGNDFQVIKKALIENRLGFEYVAMEDDDVPVLQAEPKPAKPSKPAKSAKPADDEDIPVLMPEAVSKQADAEATLKDLEQKHRLKLARVLKEQRLRIKTLASQHQAEIEELTRKSRIESQAHKNKLQELEQSLKQTRVLYEQTKTKLQKRSDQFLNLQDEMTKYRKKLAVLEKELSAALTGEEAERLKQRMEGELTILKEQLDRREAEIYYRNEREEQLRMEIQKLKEDLDSSGDSLMLSRLSELDVVFVVYHPGAGHLTLPVQDIQRYMDNPLGYVAERCSVSEEVYKEWLDHYEKPSCDFKVPGRGVCGKSVNRIAAPSDFVPGESNRCEEHQVG